MVDDAQSQCQPPIIPQLNLRRSIMRHDPRPASLLDLFVSFTLLALQGFGGVLAVVQREMVERKQWLTPEEFIEDWAVAQIMPGPNVVNLSLMIGDRYFGLRGALTALAGMLCVPLLVVLAWLLYAQYGSHPGVSALRGMAAVTAGMIAATGLKLASALRTHPLPRWQTGDCAAVRGVRAGAAAAAGLHAADLGGLGYTLTYRKLKGARHERGAFAHRPELERLAQFVRHYMLLSLMSIGGAISTTTEMHRYLVVEHQWLTQAQFNNAIAIAQAAPGPNVLFVALMGWNVGLNAGSYAAGVAGVAVTMLGILIQAPP
jgi:chromate transporter